MKLSVLTLQGMCRNMGPIIKIQTAQQIHLKLYNMLPLVAIHTNSNIRYTTMEQMPQQPAEAVGCKSVILS